MALDSLYEAAWDLGEYQSGAQQLEPEGSAQTILGLVGDDGLPYRRGGCTYKSNAAFGTGLLWAADHDLGGGRRTVFGHATAVGVLGADDATSTSITTTTSGAVERPVVVADMLVAGRSGVAYGGVRSFVGPYSTGTVAVTLGSPTVTGTGTLWLSNGEAGAIFGVASDYRYVVKSIDTNTQITLSRPYAESTATGAGYALARSLALTGGQIVTSVVNRLLIASGSAVLFSAIYAPASFSADDFHLFPGSVLALAPLRDTAMVFTGAGVYTISNMAFDLTDAQGNPQHRVELVNADLIAWGHEGIAPWKGALVVPALDGVWLMDGLSAPTRISDRTADLYLGYVRAGYKAGVAEVFNGHYLLPILTASNVWVDTLVCRLQPTHNGGDFAWSQLSGFGAQVTGYAERSSSPPVLLGASTASSSRVLNCTSYFQPAAAVKQDADGSTHPFQLVTRNIPTGGNVKNAVKHLKVKYLLTAAIGDSPTMTMEANPDGAGWTTLALGGGTPTAGTNDGYQEVYWIVNMAARFIRFRLSLASDDAIQVQPKSIQAFILKSGRY